MNKRFLTGSLLAITAFVSGCLKDTKYSEIDKTAPIVEFPIGGPGVVENSFDVTDISKNLDTSVAINIASPQPLDHDVQVTVQVTPTIVTEYNTTSGSTYTPLPATDFSIDNYTVTIPKGYRVGRFKIRFLLPKFDLNQTYALGLQIVSAPGLTISGNFNKFLWSFNLRNQFDGIYRLKGSILRSGDPVKTGTVPTYEMPLVTAGANSVIFGDLQHWADGTNVGINNPFLDVNPTTFAVTVSSSPSITPPVTTTNGYNSRYVQATKTFYISFYWNGDPASRLCTDTLTYLRPRP